MDHRSYFNDSRLQLDVAVAVVYLFFMAHNDGGIVDDGASFDWFKLSVFNELWFLLPPKDRDRGWKQRLKTEPGAWDWNLELGTGNDYLASDQRQSEPKFCYISVRLLYHNSPIRWRAIRVTPGTHTRNRKSTILKLFNKNWKSRIKKTIWD